MSGETDLAVLLATMRPQLHDGTYVFTTNTSPPTADELVQAVAVIREDEGITLVVPAPADTPSDRMAWITLTVHSSLAAIGLTAAVAAAFTGQGISCNVIAGFHHDHLFVPAARSADAMEALRALSDRHS